MGDRRDLVIEYIAKTCEAMAGPGSTTLDPLFALQDLTAECGGPAGCGWDAAAAWLRSLAAEPDWEARYNDAEARCADLERRLAATRHIPPASRMGWYVCCVVDSRGETIATFHMEVPGGEPISEVARREATHYLQTHHVRGAPPVRLVLIPTTADLTTIGPEVDARIVDPESDDELPSLEEARRELRAEGIDPDELGRRMRERVESMLREVTPDVCAEVPLSVGDLVITDDGTHGVIVCVQPLTACWDLHTAPPSPHAPRGGFMPRRWSVIPCPRGYTPKRREAAP